MYSFDIAKYSLIILIYANTVWDGHCTILGKFTVIICRWSSCVSTGNVDCLVLAGALEVRSVKIIIDDKKEKKQNKGKEKKG